ncbi:TPA: hypothetical protein ACGSMI_004146, partial [Escherichia coli]
MPENDRHPGGCLCHDGIKFLKFFTFSAIACSRNNDAALLFFCQKNNSITLIFVCSRSSAITAGFFYFY